MNEPISRERAELIEKLAIAVHQDRNPGRTWDSVPQHYQERICRQVLVTLTELDKLPNDTAKRPRFSEHQEGGVGGVREFKPLCVLQPWVQNLTLMQQAVLITAIRGPDGIAKYNAPKMLLRWYRRCVLLGSFERTVLPAPDTPGGGSFTGPSIHPPLTSGAWEAPMWEHFMEYCRALDTIPAHYQGKLRQGAEIIGYKHPDPRIRAWWFDVYITMVTDLHLLPEPEAELDKRLGDRHADWLERSNPATVK